MVYLRALLRRQPASRVTAGKAIVLSDRRVARQRVGSKEAPGVSRFGVAEMPVLAGHLPLQSGGQRFSFRSSGSGGNNLRIAESSEYGSESPVPRTVCTSN
jgi:hypothetical protein